MYLKHTPLTQKKPPKLSLLSKTQLSLTSLTRLRLEVLYFLVDVAYNLVLGAERPILWPAVSLGAIAQGAMVILLHHGSLPT